MLQNYVLLASYVITDHLTMQIQIVIIISYALLQLEVASSLVSVFSLRSRKLNLFVLVCVMLCT